MICSKARIHAALVVIATAFISACGSDSTGPGSIDTNAALQSLSLVMEGVGEVGPPTAPQLNASFGGIAPLLDQVTVTIDGASQTMFGLGLRETFPDGTCEETLFVDPAFPPEPGVCTPPLTGLLVVLWQSHSATQPPDRMIVIFADTGTSGFDPEAGSGSYQLPLDFQFALYTEGEEDVWSSLSGTLTSRVAPTAQSCDLPLPPYAKSGVCNIATFDEQGSIVFEPFLTDAPSTRRLNLTIPRQTLHGLLMSISEIQPIPFTMNGTTYGLSAPGFMSVIPRFTRAIAHTSPQTIPGR
jgi:hypothetical protein